jgi:hypothetical protein
MENDLIKDLIRESLMAKWAAIFAMLVSIFNVWAFVWLFHLVNQ